MLLTMYCWLNAAFYALFSVWCIASEERTSHFIGLTPVHAGGRTEYWAIYGGLQAGVAIFYACAALRAEHQQTALLFSVCLYGGIVFFRTCAAIREGFGNLGTAWFAYSLEIGLLAAAIALMATRFGKVSATA